VRHSLSLKDGNKAAGTVKFDVEMHAYATVAAYMRDLRIVSPEVSKDLKLEYSYSMCANVVIADLTAKRLTLRCAGSTLKRSGSTAQRQNPST
jgi:hypothetical protein